MKVISQGRYYLVFTEYSSKIIYLNNDVIVNNRNLGKILIIRRADKFLFMVRAFFILRFGVSSWVRIPAVEFSNVHLKSSRIIIQTNCHINEFLVIVQNVTSQITLNRTFQ